MTRHPSKKTSGKSPFKVTLHDGEMDEMFVSNADVHIERMDVTSFWIGIRAPGGQWVCLNTGVQRGVWYFNLEEDTVGGFEHFIQRPRKSK